MLFQDTRFRFPVENTWYFEVDNQSKKKKKSGNRIITSYMIESTKIKDPRTCSSANTRYTIRRVTRMSNNGRGRLTLFGCLQLKVLF